MADRLTIEISGDAHKLISALKESGVNVDKFTDKAKKGGKEASAGMGGLNSAMAGLSPVSLTAAGAIGALAAGLKTSIELARVQVAAEAQLNAVLESTHGAAGLTADELKKLASGLQSVTNYGDEAIIPAESLLLTFTKIGGDIIPQATETVLDMSTALGQDLKSSAIQLGKALNDPVEGVTALKRVGVSFTEAQMEQIKTMVEAGDVAGAQALILKELQTEFGGSARAAREADGDFIAAKNSLGDLGETIGKTTLPAMTALNKQVIAAADGWNTTISSLALLDEAAERYRDNQLEAAGATESLTESWARSLPVVSGVMKTYDLVSGYVFDQENLAEAVMDTAGATDTHTDSLGDNQAAIEDNTKALEEQEKQQRELMNTQAGYFGDLAGLRERDREQEEEYVRAGIELAADAAERKVQIAADLTETLADINKQELDDREQMTERMVDLDEDLAKSREQLSKKIKDLNEDEARDKERLSRKLADLDRNLADSRKELTDKLSDLNDDEAADKEKLTKKLNDLNEEEATKKAELIKELQGKDDARLQEELAKLSESNDKKRSMVQEEYNEVEAAYTKKWVQIQEDMAREKEQYDRKRQLILEEQKELRESYDEKRAMAQQDMAEAEANYNKKRAIAQQELDALAADYADKRAKAEADAQAELALIENTLAEKKAKLDADRATEEEANAKHLEELKLKTALHVLETTGQLEELTKIAGIKANDAYELVTAGIISIDGELGSALQNTLQNFSNQTAEVNQTAGANATALQQIYTGSFSAIGAGNSEMAGILVRNSRDIEQAAMAAASAYDRMRASGMSRGDAAAGARYTGQAAASGAMPSFDGGGVVPGPKGAPMPILAHGGEIVLTPGQQGGVTIGNINLYGVQDPQAMFEAIQREARNRGMGFVGG
jgi:hypothetical protein